MTAIRARATAIVGALLLAGVASAAEDLRARQLASKAFRAAVAKVVPSLVTIETYGGVMTPATPPASPGGAPGRGRRRMRPVAKPGEGPTTGLVASADGHIVTSTFNFLRKPPVITVVLQDGSRHVAKLLGRDETRKLCLLKVDGVLNLPVPVHAPRDGLKVGQWAISVGLGYGGEEPALSAGIVSATSRIFGRAVQTDANISPANYGGPLVDIEGRVIGICVPLSPGGQGPADGVAWYDSGIGFAVPLADLASILDQMKAGKTIQPGRLGILPEPQPPKGGGVTVRTVQEGSGAGKAGIQPKDIITALDGKPVADLAALRVLLGRRIAGEEIAVTLKRGDEELTLQVVLGTGKPDAPPPTRTRTIRTPPTPR